MAWFRRFEASRRGCRRPGLPGATFSALLLLRLAALSEDMVGLEEDARSHEGADATLGGTQKTLAPRHERLGLETPRRGSRGFIRSASKRTALEQTAGDVS